MSACAPTYTDAPGVSNRSYAAAAPESSKAREIEPLFARIHALPTASTKPSRSRGHLFDEAQVQLTVRVDPDSLARYLTWTVGAELRPGAVVFASHASQGRALDLYLMEKLAVGGWRFQRLTPQGYRLPTEAGLCQGCHTDAVSDLLFGLPRVSIPRLSPPVRGDAGPPQKIGDPEG